jgi:SpoVK/Ycf46/Vps4 family AAA+-type ATPase
MRTVNKAVFERAQKFAPAVILFDEIDSCKTPHKTEDL